MAVMISVGWDIWQVYPKPRAQAKLARRGFTDRKERIRRRTDLLGRKKLQVATARRLSSGSSGKGALATTGPGSDKPTIT